MTISRAIVAKRIEQLLVLAAILAYWAPALSYVGAKIEANIPAFQVAAHQAKNTTVAYEAFDQAVTASVSE